MSITALEIQEVRFGEVKRGYDPNEVDEFLERVAADVDTLNRALSEAAARIKSAERRAEEAEAQLAQAATQVPVPLAVPYTPPPAPVESVGEAAISGEVIAKAFIAAQKSADAIQEEARREAEKVYREAESRGRDIVREALSEKQKTLEELGRLRESCEKFRTEYLSLLRYFQSDAQKRLTAFDDIIQAQPLDEAKAGSLGGAIGDSAFAASEAPKGVRAGAAMDPFSAPSFPATFDDEDDLDIEEID